MDLSKKWYLVPRSGVLWQWKSQQILSLITKIRSMNPSEIAGLICWALGYWEKEGTPLEVSIRQYSEDLEQIYTPLQRGNDS